MRDRGLHSSLMSIAGLKFLDLRSHLPIKSNCAEITINRHEDYRNNKRII